MKQQYFTFKKPYVFEGETYQELDMTPFETVTGEQLYETEKHYIRGGGNPIGMEYSLSFVFLFCSIVLEKPIEFFQNMSATDVYHLKYWVGSFFEGTVL